jgi:uncharacterized membrane protein
MNTTRTTPAPYLMLLFSCIGIAIASYDSYAIYTGGQLWCPPPIDGCNIVAHSPYARLFGVPLGYLGLLFYSSLIFTAALLLYAPYSRGLRGGAVLHAGVGVLFSIYFMYIQIAFIHAFCIYCFMSAVLMILLLSAAIVHLKAMRRARTA